MARILACVFRWTRQNIKNKQTAREKERERVNESERVYREKNPKFFSLYSEMRLVVLLFSPFAFFLSFSLSFVFLFNSLSCEPIPFAGTSCASWRQGPWIRRGQIERQNGSMACSRRGPQKCWGTFDAGENDPDRSTVIYCAQTCPNEWCATIPTIQKKKEEERTKIRKTNNNRKTVSKTKTTLQMASYEVMCIFSTESRM